MSISNEKHSEDPLDDTPSMKFLYTTRVGFALITSIFSLVPLFFKAPGNNPYLYLITSFGLIVIFWVLSYRFLTNVITFSVLLFLLSVVFPVLHFIIYKSDKSNYNFEPQFLISKSKSLDQNSINHIDTFYLNNILLSQDSILQNDISKIPHDNIIFLKDYLLKFEIKPPKLEEQGVQKSVLGIYKSDGLKLGTIEIENIKTIREAIENEKNIFLAIKNMSKNPDANILINDFWIESVTGFTFSHIKPISNLSITIRIFQFVIVFLFLAMITNTLRASGKFVLERKK
jgi:hypothetical protein